MKNKIIILLVACMTVIALAACGSSNSGKETTAQTEPAASGTAADTTAPAAEDKGFTFTYKGVTVYITQDSAEAVDSLKEFQSGEPTQIPSCAFEGFDYQYFYGSFYMFCGTLNGKEIVDNISLIDDTVSTEEGLSIGDSKAKVEELYGAEGFDNVNAYVYDKGHCELTIIIKDDEVYSIQYQYK